MSQWTHVCGCVRIDHLFNWKVINPRIKEAFGKVLQYESPEQMWDEQKNHPERYTPTGSEGGVEYNVWENPDKRSMASHTVSIFGDLRDYNNAEEIIEWFNKICKSFMIRDAVLNIDIEYEKTVTVIYDGRDKPCRIIEQALEET
jgi:hypothetical protein